MKGPFAACKSLDNYPRSTVQKDAHTGLIFKYLRFRKNKRFRLCDRRADPNIPFLTVHRSIALPFLPYSAKFYNFDPAERCR
jgi:hypothetical protein